MIKFEQRKGEAATSEPPFIAAGWRGNRHFQTIWPNRIKRDPASAQLEDGSILTIYYQVDRAGEPTCLMGTKWHL